MLDPLRDVPHLLEHFPALAAAQAAPSGTPLIGLRIETWVTGKSKVSELFQTRDLLNAVAMMLTFDDTAYFIKAVGPVNAEDIILKAQ